MPTKKFSVDGSGPKDDAKSKKKSGGGQDQKKTVMVAIAVACFLGAGAVTAFQLGLFGGGAQQEQLTAADTGPAPEDLMTEKEKQQFKRQMEIIERNSANAPRAGS